MPSSPPEVVWDFDSAINLLKSYSLDSARHQDASSKPDHNLPTKDRHVTEAEIGLGDFSDLWEFLGQPRLVKDEKTRDIIRYEVNEKTVAELDARHLGKGVKWRDELDGADLEDNAEPFKISAANVRTQKRAARRARAREKARSMYAQDGGNTSQSEGATDSESDNELESLRKVPDRRSIIANILGRRPPTEITPPTSPSPPKVEARTPSKKEWPVSNPFLWSTPEPQTPNHRTTLVPQDGLTPTARKARLIKKLAQACPDEKKYLLNSGITEPAFAPLNVSSIGIHVFIDMSNISIGFHDCLKLKRDIPISVRVRRVPMSFHNFSLVLERGRPAAKRVLVGSDRTATITQAKTIGYETNILERVHKAKELTPRQKKFQSRPNGINGNTSASGPGETSGSETNNGFSSSTPFQPAKWVEQAVDEILHLKILESIIDADKPSTIVLATGDAAEAEYSGGFMRMVERALGKGWVVELVSFRLNTSSAYMRREFRAKWGPMFKWIQLDDYAEYLVDEE